MVLIKNVQVGTCGIDPLVLSTLGVSSCIGVVIELQTKVFMYHAGTDSFNASPSSSIKDAIDFLREIYDKFCQLDEVKNIKNTFIIGGWYDANYIRLRNNINIILEYYGKENTKSSDRVSQNPDGKDKNVDEDDHPDDYIFDSTIIYDRSSTPHTFLICQYSGIEDDMDIDKNNSLLQVVYQFDLTLKNFKAFITSNAPESPYYCDLVNQVLFNVKDPLFMHHCLDDNFKNKIDNLLSRVESTSFFDGN